jgi:hypothetical protein
MKSKADQRTIRKKKLFDELTSWQNNYLIKQLLLKQLIKNSTICPSNKLKHLIIKISPFEQIFWPISAENVFRRRRRRRRRNRSPTNNRIVSTKADQGPML